MSDNSKRDYIITFQKKKNMMGDNARSGNHIHIPNHIYLIGLLYINYTYKLLSIIIFNKLINIYFRKML